MNMSRRTTEKHYSSSEMQRRRQQTDFNTTNSMTNTKSRLALALQGNYAVTAHCSRVVCSCDSLTS